VGSYRVLIKPSAAKEIEAVDQKRVRRQRNVASIFALADEPRPVGCEKLAGEATVTEFELGDIGLCTRSKTMSYSFSSCESRTARMSIDRPPNTRVQWTRTARFARQCSPLTRSPLGGRTPWFPTISAGVDLWWESDI
jgi:hypothetical protein